MCQETILWSDGMYFEENNAWFVSSMISALFHWEINTGKCRLLAELPDFDFCNFRRNPVCYKHQNWICCFPDTGDVIWVYDLNTADFSSINIPRTKNCRLAIYNIWGEGERVWVLAAGLKAVIEININKKKIANICTIIEDAEDNIGGCTRSGNSLFILSREKGILYEYQMYEKTVCKHIIEGLEDRVGTLYIDNNYFWFSGYKKNIFCWDMKGKQLIKVEGFPEDFGCYNYQNDSEQLLDTVRNEYMLPTFQRCCGTSEYIWFIPFQTNQIIYVDKINYKIHTFDIPQEKESYSSLRSRGNMLVKYVFQYQRSGGIVGLYSPQNKKMLEIDIYNKTFEYRQICVEQIELIKLVERNWNTLRTMIEGNDDYIYRISLCAQVDGFHEKMTRGDKIYKMT